MNRIISLFLFIFVANCLTAQYNSPIKNKVTLGVQTTADGLVYRGNAADTVAATLKITKTNKQDTSSYLLLDTINNVFLKYNIGTTYWTRLNILPTDTASMLGNYWRSGRFSGVLPVANGGTNASTFTLGSVVFAGASGTYTQDNASLFYDNINDRLGIGTSSPTQKFEVSGGSLIVSGFANRAEGTGKAIEIGMDGTNAVFQAINRTTNAFIPFLINSSNTMILGGDVGIGTPSFTPSFTPLSRLSILINDNQLNGITLRDNSVITSSFQYNDSTGENRIGGLADYAFPTLYSGGIERMRIITDGELQIAGTTDRGAYNLQVNGTGVWGEGAYVNGSDANIKENIIDLDSSLNIVNNLKPVVFNYINTSVNNDTKHLGFIAQDVYQTLETKEYVNSIVRSDGNTLSIAYSNLIPLLTKAIQEQQAQIEALKQRLLILENK
jgi:hypothetical protein